ncbi:hypothetical protein [Parvicella tangerina]|uniref:Tetratricopeptide repeat protein n=1 Tax=Parvicella tangerina TaxID=2829795 RepID=A0A916JLM0_9FLAO|nr:hypothetical protein [Parvicella tangerina]CAG5079155.1 hypothetical protein CRYO30217_00874 [Parvicella tangerina]
MSKHEKNTSNLKIGKFLPYYLGIFVLAFIFYGNSMKNEYSMDDNLVTSTYNSKHPTVEGGIASIPKIFTSHFVVNNKQSYAYRPVTTTSFAIEYQFFGQNPTVSHFFNILLYAIGIVVLFRVLNQIWGEEKYILTVLSCFIFLIHPIHSEVVNNIKSRDELLSFLFGILALKQALNHYDKKKILSLILSFVFILMSLLSKKTGMIFIALLPLTLYYFRSINLKRVGVIVSVVVVGFVVFKFMGKTLLSDPVARVKYYFENPLYYTGFADRIPMFFYSNWYYLSLMILPYPLRYYYGYDQVPIADWSNPLVYLMLLVMVASVGIAVWRIKRKEIWGYGVLFYFLGIGGACNLLFPAVGIIAERFAFIASLGFSILVAYGIYYYFFQQEGKFANSKNLIKITLGILSVVCLGYVFNRNKAWKTDTSLYKTDIVHLDQSYKAHNMLGQAYYTEGIQLASQNSPANVYMAKVDSAEREFLACLSIYDQYAVTFNNLGALNYSFRGNVDTAYYYFSRAVEIDSNYLEASYNLGNVEFWNWKSYFYLIDAIKTLPSDSSTTNKKIDPSSAKQVDMLGSTLERLRSNCQSTISNSANGATDNQTFLSNLKNNTLSLVASFGLKTYFNEQEFEQIIQTNAGDIISSYSSGTLDKHLFKFLSVQILKNYYSQVLSQNATIKQIEDYAQERMNYFEKNLLPHLSKCFDLDPTYYPPYNTMHEYYEIKKDFQKVIEINEKALKVNEFQYFHEFYTKIAVAYVKLNQLDQAYENYLLALDEFDRNIREINEDTGAHPQESQKKQAVLAKVIQQRKFLLKKLISLSEQLGKFEDNQQFKSLLQSN